jgi:hypothetical protein
MMYIFFIGLLLCSGGDMQIDPGRRDEWIAQQRQLEREGAAKEATPAQTATTHVQICPIHSPLHWAKPPRAVMGMEREGDRLSNGCTVSLGW